MKNARQVANRIEATERDILRLNLLIAEGRYDNEEAAHKLEERRSEYKTLIWVLDKHQEVTE